MLPRNFTVHPIPKSARKKGESQPTVEMSLGMYACTTLIGGVERHMMCAELLVIWRDNGSVRIPLHWNWIPKAPAEERDWIPFYGEVINMIGLVHPPIIGPHLHDDDGGMIFGPYPEEHFRLGLGELRAVVEGLIPGVPFGTPLTSESAAK